MSRQRHAWQLAAAAIALAVSAAALGPAAPARAEEPWKFECNAYDSLKHELAAAEGAGDRAKTLEIAAKLNDIVETEHAELLYAIARRHALAGEKIKTYEWLDRAVGAGYWNARFMRDDEAFKPWREEQRFKSIVRGAWANGYIAMLERPERADFQKPEEVMRALDLKPGMRVADIGAGSGYFTIPVAKAIRPGGSVLAIDISQEMLDYLGKRIASEQLDNVKLAKVKADDPELPAAGLDLILMVDTIHYVQNKGEYAKKLRAGLAPGGRLVIIDYIPKSFEERPWGPAPEQQISKEALDKEMALGGLAPITVHDFLTEQYFVVYGAE